MIFRHILQNFHLISRLRKTPLLRHNGLEKNHSEDIPNPDYRDMQPLIITKPIEFLINNFGFGLFNMFQKSLCRGRKIFRT